MNCNQANEISIVDFLSSHGIEPVKTRGKDVWYLSPLRIEKSASFKVDTSLNRWFDFGIAKGGKLVDLATQLLNVSIEELLGRLAGSHFERVPLVSMVKDKEQDSVRLLSIKKLEHRLLIKYLIERGINVTIATEHCFEISYATEARNYFGIGFRNDVNGFEARNKYFKGSIGPKGISSRIYSLDKFSLFEGFFDYLSAIQLQLGIQSAIILNSVNQAPKVIEALRLYQPRIVEAFFDNDDAGRQCFAELQKRIPQAIDKSSQFVNHKDLNEMLMKQKHNQI